MHVYKSKDGKGERRKFNGEVLGGVGCEMVQIRGEDSTGFVHERVNFLHNTSYAAVFYICDQNQC